MPDVKPSTRSKSTIPLRRITWSSRRIWRMIGSTAGLSRMVLPRGNGHWIYLVLGLVSIFSIGGFGFMLTI